MARKLLNLTRDQLASFLKDPEQIKQFENLFAASNNPQLAGGAAGSIPYQSSAGVTTFLPIGLYEQVLQVNLAADAPEWVSSTGSGNVVRSSGPTLSSPILGTPASGTLTNCTGLPISTGVSGMGTGVSTFLATPSSANLSAAVTDETGSGSLVFAISPDLVTPLLGTPTSGTLTNCTGLPISTGISGLATGVATFLATPTSSNLAAALTDETGSGSLVFATSPTLVTPVLGTPTSGTLTNCTGLPVSTGIAGLGTGVATALGVNVGTAGAVVVNGDALGTPSSGTLTSCTGLPISTGVSGLGANVATFLATPSSANLATAVTDETGTGSLVFGTNAALTNPTITNGRATNLDYVGFKNAPTLGTVTPGTVYWDDGNGTLSLNLKGGNVDCLIGEQEYARVYNDTASTLTKGQIVYISGAQGNRVAVKLAKADSDANSAHTIGFVAETITAGGEGWVQISGPIYKLNTFGTIAGDTVYLSPTTSGAWTTTKPVAPNHLVILGFIERVHDTVGSIFIKVDNGYELDELHNVKITSVANNDILQYDNTGQFWKNVEPSSVSVGTATNLAGGAAGSLPYQSGAGATTFLSIGTNNFVLTSNGTAPVWTTNTGTGSVVRATSPTITTPTITTSITAPLLIGGTGTTSTLALRSTSGVGTTGADIIFQTGNNGATEAMRILNSGNVGIGTNSPATKLNVGAIALAGGLTGTAAFVSDTSSSIDAETTVIIGQGGSTVGSWVGLTAGIITGGSPYFSIKTRPTVGGTSIERMRIDGSGNFGIGTNAPGFRLDAQSAIATGIIAKFAATTASTALITFADATPTTVGPQFGSAGNSLVFRTNSTGSAAERMRIDSAGNVLVTGVGGLGYGTGSGGAVTQITSRTQGVTLNKTNGAITLVSAAGTTAWQSFTVTNSTVAATDVVKVCQKSGTDLYMIHVTNVAAGSFKITFATTGGTTTEQPVFNFAVIKAVTA